MLIRTLLILKSYDDSLQFSYWREMLCFREGCCSSARGRGSATVLWFHIYFLDDKNGYDVLSSDGEDDGRPSFLSIEKSGGFLDKELAASGFTRKDQNEIGKAIDYVGFNCCHGRRKCKMGLGFQPVLPGVAVGCGWQVFVAYVNVSCYYIIGVPGGVLGFKFGFGLGAKEDLRLFFF